MVCDIWPVPELKWASTLLLPPMLFVPLLPDPMRVQPLRPSSNSALTMGRVSPGGRKVDKRHYSTLKSGQEVVLPLSAYDGGVYTIRIKTSKSDTTRKLMR